MEDRKDVRMGCPDDYPRQLSRLITRIDRRRARYMNSMFEGTGLQGMMFFTLLALDRHPGDSQDSLSEYMLADKSVVARNAGALEKMGYITRCVDDENRRQYKVYLTEQGRAVIPEIRRRLAQWSALLTGGLTDAERLTALELLGRMEGNIQF